MRLPPILLSRAARWILCMAAALLIPIALLVAFFDWNWAREPISRRVSALSGRSFAIQGNLDVRLSLRPRIVADDVVLGNASWSTDPVMAQVQRIDFRIDLLKLLVGRIDLPELALSQPRILLEVSRRGAANWVFKEGSQAGSAPLPVDREAVDRRGRGHVPGCRPNRTCR